MRELEHLRTLWSLTPRRSKNLIVDLTYDGDEGSLNNESWTFNVPYAFREALDIKYEQLMKAKEPYWAWTQGPLLNFKAGNLMNSRDGSRAIQVESGSQMEVQMYEGSVVYTEYSISNGRYVKLREQICTQMQLLQLLIHGDYDPQPL